MILKLRIFQGTRLYLPIQAVPKLVINAFLAAETRTL